MHIQLTPDNSNPRQLEPKSISPGFPSYIYCHFTLGNLNFPLTQSNFFPFSSFLHNFTLDNSNHVNRCVKSREKNRALKSETLNLFQNNQANSLSLLFVTPVQIQCSSHILLLNCIPFPSICLFPYLRLFASNA